MNERILDQDLTVKSPTGEVTIPKGSMIIVHEPELIHTFIQIEFEQKQFVATAHNVYTKTTQRASALG